MEIGILEIHKKSQILEILELKTSDLSTEEWTRKLLKSFSQFIFLTLSHQPYLDSKAPKIVIFEFAHNMLNCCPDQGVHGLGRAGPGKGIYRTAQL